MKLDVEGLSNYIGVENALADLEASVKADTQVEDATTQSVT